MHIKRSKWLAILVSSALTCGCNSSATGADDWVGAYTYEADAGETGGVAAVVEYKLTVTKDSCAITVQGFQADESIVCTASPQDRQLVVRFKQYANGQVVNEFGTAIYKPNETLFSLMKAGAALNTEWGALKPDAVEQAKGVFFRKG